MDYLLACALSSDGDLLFIMKLTIYTVSLESSCLRMMLDGFGFLSFQFSGESD